METSSMDVILVLGAFAGMLTGFFAIVKYILGQAVVDRGDDREERQALTAAIALMADSSRLVAEATAKGNREAKERNGHLGEQNIQLAQLIADQNKSVSDISKATQLTAKILSKSALIAAEDRDQLMNGSQHITEQTVENQIIKERS